MCERKVQAGRPSSARRPIPALTARRSQACPTAAHNLKQTTGACLERRFDLAGDNARAKPVLAFDGAIVVRTGGSCRFCSG